MNAYCGGPWGPLVTLPPEAGALAPVLTVCFLTTALWLPLYALVLVSVVVHAAGVGTRRCVSLWA
jgi:hypothetical protein